MGQWGPIAPEHVGSRLTSANNDLAVLLLWERR